jgi:hypothetical protein
MRPTPAYVEVHPLGRKRGTVEAAQQRRTAMRSSLNASVRDI